MAASIKRQCARELLKLMGDQTATVAQKLRMAVIIREMLGVTNSDPSPAENVESVFGNIDGLENPTMEDILKLPTSFPE